MTLSWEPGRDADNNINTTVQGYNVYNGLETRNYVKVRNSLATTPLVTQTYTVTGLEVNKTHYFAVTAYNEAGESTYSDEASTTITSCGSSVKLNLSWKVTNEIKK